MEKECKGKIDITTINDECNGYRGSWNCIEADVNIAYLQTLKGDSLASLVLTLVGKVQQLDSRLKILEGIQ